MAERRNSPGRGVDTQNRVKVWRQDPPRKTGSGRALVGALVVLGGVAAIIVADDEWAWRDTLRRIARGEEVPAFRASAWSDAHSVRESLADNLLTSDLSPSVDDRETRRDLALHALVSAAGVEVISRSGPEMGKLMEDFCVNVEWLEEIVYFSPLAHAEAALPILAHIYQSQAKKMEGMLCNRRLAAAVAFEFARAGLSKEQALEAFLFYAASGQKNWLNSRFEQLALWEMRVIASRCADGEWGSKATLSWFQDNCRLPAQGYVWAGQSLGTRERSLFGVSVDTPDFQALYRDAAEGGAASMYEASGCSTVHSRALYAATAACANGVPALVVANESEATCLVDVNGSWKAASPVPEAANCSWSFMGQSHPDFVELVARLGSDMETFLSSARLAYMGQFLYDAGNKPLAHSYFREAVKAQPLNYAAWAAYHACGAPEAEIAEAGKHFESLPGVASALRSQAVK